MIYTIDEARAVTVLAESTPEGGVSQEVSEGHYDGYLGGRWSAWSRHDIVVARVPEWLVAEHHSAPTGRAPGRPNGAKD